MSEFFFHNLQVMNVAPETPVDLSPRLWFFVQRRNKVIKIPGCIATMLAYHLAIPIQVHIRGITVDYCSHWLVYTFQASNRFWMRRLIGFTIKLFTICAFADLHTVQFGIEQNLHTLNIETDRKGCHNVLLMLAARVHISFVSFWSICVASHAPSYLSPFLIPNWWTWRPNATRCPHSNTINSLKLSQFHSSLHGNIAGSPIKAVPSIQNRFDFYSLFFFFWWNWKLLNTTYSIIYL